MEEQIKEIICNQLVLPCKIKGSNSLKKLGIDSLDMVEIIMALEDEFLVKIDRDDAEKWLLVKDVIDYIKDVKNG